MIVSSDGTKPTTARSPEPVCAPPQTQPITFWNVVQGLAVVAGLAVSLREISRW
jgi:hypothetical protein